MHKKTVVLYDKDGDEREVQLPAVWKICTRCEGNGTHTNPSVDGNGITASEFMEWDPEEREGYFAGHYDVTCEECGGSGKVEVVDEEALKAQSPEDYVDWCENIGEEDEYQQMADEEAKWERRMLHGSDD